MAIKELKNRTITVRLTERQYQKLKSYKQPITTIIENLINNNLIPKKKNKYENI